MTSGDRDVLTSLPRSRSTRRSAKRGSTPAAGESAAEAPAKKAPAATPKAKPAGAKAKRKPAAAKKTAPGKTQAAAPPPPPPAGWAAPKGDAGGDRQAGGELLGTAVQAVGELAQIGLTFGGQALRQALSRFPRP